jgi:hypothetical protein
MKHLLNMKRAEWSLGRTSAMGGKSKLSHPKCGVILDLAAARLLFEF